MEKLTGKGGAGRGQGRKPLSPGRKRKQIAGTIPSDLVEWVRGRGHISEDLENAIRLFMAKENGCLQLRLDGGFDVIDRKGGKS